MQTAICSDVPERTPLVCHASTEAVQRNGHGVRLHNDYGVGGAALCREM